MTPSAAAPTITGIRQIAITVRDVEQSLAFYRDTVGLPFLFSAGPRLAFLAAGDVRIMLSAPEAGFTPGGGMALYFKVADILAAHRELESRGVVFTEVPRLVAAMPDHDLWLGAFDDLDGNHLALMAELPKAD